MRLTHDTTLDGQGKLGGVGAKPGDSGGAVFSGHRALGTQAATNNQTEKPSDSADYFTQMQNTLNRLDAQLVTSKPQPRFGFNELWMYDGWHPKQPDGVVRRWPPGGPADPDPDSAPFTKAFSLGVDTNRFGVPWGDAATDLDPPGQAGCPVFPKSNLGGIQWRGRYEQPYERMIRAGVRPIIVLSATPNCFSKTTRCTDANGVQHTGEAPPDDSDVPDPALGGVSPNEAWADYARAVAHRFPQALAFEVWNEPNLPEFWGGCGDDPFDDPKNFPSAARYTELLAIASPAIRGVQPTATVVTAGLSPAGADWMSYLRQILSAGAAAHADALALHPYRQAIDDKPNARNATLDFAEAAFRQLRRAREIRADQEVYDPFWVTEVGVGVASKEAHKRVADEAAQADQLVKVYRTLRDHGVPAITFHRFVDGDGVGVDDPAWEQSVGVLRRDPPTYTSKPAYCKLAQERDRSACP